MDSAATPSQYDYKPSARSNTMDPPVRREASPAPTTFLLSSTVRDPYTIDRGRQTASWMTSPGLGAFESVASLNGGAPHEQSEASPLRRPSATRSNALLRRSQIGGPPSDQSSSPYYTLSHPASARVPPALGGITHGTYYGATRHFPQILRPSSPTRSLDELRRAHRQVKRQLIRTRNTFERMGQSERVSAAYASIIAEYELLVEELLMKLESEQDP